ncbi:MAG: antibiotic biosynthesis monooxygenase [Burkholderiales bacterium]|nr:antibiotic biosynthesis monooxygenase [Burkholderiales bacterium]
MKAATLQAQVSFVVHLPFKPERTAQGRQMVMDIVREMSREPEFINTWINEMQDEPDTLVLYETWACSRDDFIARQLPKPYRVAYEAQLPALLSGERHILFLTPLAGFPTRST